jgi:hypothetical protein
MRLVGLLGSGEASPQFSSGRRGQLAGNGVAGRLSARWAWLALGCLVVVSAIIRWRVASLIPSPWFTPDEQTYAELGRSLYRSGDLSILGHHAPFYSLVYPAIAGIPLSFSDTEGGYAWLKAAQALLMSLTAVPVYLWGRTLMARTWALAAAALTLTLPGLAFAGFVMTEVAFYPVLCLAAWATARMLERPTAVNQLAAVGGVVLAVLTRLQAIVLVPAVVTAVLLLLLFDRRPRRELLRFMPAVAGLAALGAVWVARPGKTLGAYAVTTTVDYRIGEVFRFALYHAADVLLFSALLPVLGLVLLTARAAAGREESGVARAYLATAVSFSCWLVAEVGVFATRFLGRLAERNLIALAPLLFLGFALWLDRGAPRPRFAFACTAAAMLGLLAYVPWNAFVRPGTEPDAFSVIPLGQLSRWAPGVSVRLAVVAVAAVLLAGAALVPRRNRWALVMVTGGLLVSASVSTSVFVTQKANEYDQLVTLGEHVWIDRITPKPVVYLYAGELGWTGGAPVWQQVFWNKRISQVYSLAGPQILGPMEQPGVRISADGRLLRFGDSRPLTVGYVVASRAIRFVGRELATLPSIQLGLWSLAQPVRVSTWSSGINTGNGDVDSEARLTAYGCRAGELRLHLVAPGDRTVELRRNGATFRSFRLRAGGTLDTVVPARPTAQHLCSFALLVLGGIHAPVFRFVRA